MNVSILLTSILIVAGLICMAEFGDAAGKRMAKGFKRGRRRNNNWRQWGEFGHCSATCGIGVTTRYRLCKKIMCRGKSFSTQPCFVQPCEEGKWKPWSNFGPCSKSCGGGIKIRKRKCKGKQCLGPDQHSKPCNKIKCKGKWSAWGPPGPCSKKCGGGKRERVRTCLTTEKCYGPSKKKDTCGTKVCPEPSIWGPWTKFAPCTKSCGTGVKVRTRNCKSKTCRGPNTQRGDCKTQLCEAASVWGEWGKFSPCSKSCGTGMKVRTRECKSRTCLRGPSKQVGNCKEIPCPGDWSECTKSCGIGTRYKFDSENCLNPGNPKCFRTFEECNNIECPEETCTDGKDYRYGMKYSCCDNEEYGGRVIKGKEAELSQWPWMVLIVFKQICGGSLIHPQWILTAAHCFSEETDPDPSSISVYVGIQNLTQRQDSSKRHLVEKLIQHPRYKDLQNDVTLLKLKDEVNTQFLSTVSTISLPLSEDTPLDSTCFTAGWGLTNPRSFTPSDPLMEVDVQVLDIGVCRKAYKDNRQVGSYVMESSKLICAGSLTKKNDACMGDSGGPLVCQRCSSCEWYLAGVTSFGPEDNCGLPGHPGMYSRVKSFESWIVGHIPSLKGKQKSCEYKYGP
uniref:coadhesin-like isoform X1 n=1 Tax=Styela clava TaxID=7725 RepID=UPI00193A2B8F|nr:coadhesin-like isoform X1 [Styela clava]